MDDNAAPELVSVWDEAKGHIDQGDYEKVVEIYRYILVRYADDDIASEYANAYLRDIFLTIRGLDFAEKHLRKAISYAPKKPHYHYLLGFTYSIREQWAKAVKEFEVSIQLDPSNGEYERGLRNIDRAREYGEDAVRIDSGHTLAQKLLEDIDRIRRKQG